MIEMRVEGLKEMVELLKTLPSEIVSRRGGPVRRALRRAAYVILRQEEINLQKVIDETAARQGNTESIGLLKKSLVVTRGKPPFDGKGERYLVRVKPNRYPRATPETVSTLKSAQLLEYGRVHQPPRPWIRAAYLQKQDEARRVFEDSLRRAIAQLIAQKRQGRI